jgi:hypothetical protein
MIKPALRQGLSKRMPDHCQGLCQFFRLRAALANEGRVNEHASMTPVLPEMSKSVNVWQQKIKNFKGR